jgi:hypothetical protein
VKDEDTALPTLVGAVNFVGAGVAVTQPTSGSATVTIGANGTWGSITGTLSNQTDLQSALDSKESALSFTAPLTRSTNTISLNPIVNADVSGSAAIAYSKLNLTGSILGGDLAGSIPDSKLLTISTPGKVVDSALSSTVSLLGQSIDLGTSEATGTLAAGRFPALTGDVTTSAGSLAATLASVVTAGTNTKITYDAKGRVTAGAQAQFSDIGGALADGQLSSNVPLKNAANVFATTQSVTMSDLQVTLTDGLALNNPSPATLLVQAQNSPDIHLIGSKWNVANEVSDSFDAKVVLTGALDMSEKAVGKLSFQMQKNEGGYLEVGYFDHLGAFTAVQVQTPPTDPVQIFMTNGGMSFIDPAIGEGLGVFSVQTKDEANDTVEIAYYKNYFRVAKFGAGTVFQTEGGATTEDAILMRGFSLTSGTLLHGVVPGSGFTGPLIKITDDAGSPVTRFEIGAAGGITQQGVTFANLGAPADGTFIYCSNCTKAATCASGGNGALAKRLNGAWDCN